MKLLSKTDIQQKKSEEKRREIDEGVKLARRVDGLRITASEEERKLALYRDKSVAYTLEQIEEIVKKQHLAEQDLLVSRAENERLRQPLDKEWAKLEDATATLEAEKLIVVNERLVVSQRESAADTKEVALLEQQRLLAIEEAKVQQKANDANAILARSEAAELALNDHATSLNTSLDKRDKELLQREALANSREKNADEREAKLLAREVTVRDEAYRVRDLFETFMRTKKPIKK